MGGWAGEQRLQAQEGVFHRHWKLAHVSQGAAQAQPTHLDSCRHLAPQVLLHCQLLQQRPPRRHPSLHREAGVVQAAEGAMPGGEQQSLPFHAALAKRCRHRLRAQLLPPHLHRMMLKAQGRLLCHQVDLHGEEQRGPLPPLVCWHLLPVGPRRTASAATQLSFEQLKVLQVLVHGLQGTLPRSTGGSKSARVCLCQDHNAPRRTSTGAGWKCQQGAAVHARRYHSSTRLTVSSALKYSSAYRSVGPGSPSCGTTSSAPLQGQAGAEGCEGQGEVGCGCSLEQSRPVVELAQVQASAGPCHDSHQGACQIARKRT